MDYELFEWRDIFIFVVPFPTTNPKYSNLRIINTPQMFVEFNQYDF